MSAQSDVDHQKRELEKITSDIRKIGDEETRTDAEYNTLKKKLDDHRKEVDRDIQKREDELKSVLDKKVELASNKARKLKEQKEREEKLRLAEESLRKENDAKNKK